MKHLQAQRTRRGGFTLLELIVVITIIGILGTIVITRVAPAIFSANQTRIKTHLKQIVNAAETIYSMTGSFPESIAEMVNAKDSQGNELPGLKEIPKDPWGNEYHYELRDGKPVAWCLGKDQQVGGTGDDTDHQEPAAENAY
jgi:general secretion pathway protein G